MSYPAEISKTSHGVAISEHRHSWSQHISVSAHANNSLVISVKSVDPESGPLLAIALSHAHSYSSVIVDTRPTKMLDDSVIGTLLRHSPGEHRTIVTTPYGFEHVQSMRLVQENGTSLIERFRWTVRTDPPEYGALDETKTHATAEAITKSVAAKRHDLTPIQLNPTLPELRLTDITTYSNSANGVFFSIDCATLTRDTREELGGFLQDLAKFPLTRPCTIDISALRENDIKTCAHILMACQVRRRRQQQPDPKQSEQTTEPMHLVIPLCFQRFFRPEVAEQSGFTVRYVENQ